MTDAEKRAKRHEILVAILGSAAGPYLAIGATCDECGAPATRHGYLNIGVASIATRRCEVHGAGAFHLLPTDYPPEVVAAFVRSGVLP